jgi:methionyl-tRNA formyltransferase
MKIVFFGTPDFANEFLKALHADEDIFVSAVVCQPDKPVGRKKELTAPATKLFAQEQEIPVIQPEKKKDILPELKKVLDGDIDAFVIVAYGKIIPQSVLDIPKKGSVNVHPSLLPKYRGPSPLQAAIKNQDAETGISIMLIDEEMDHGPILRQLTFQLKGSETFKSLSEEVAKLGGPLLVKTLKSYVAGDIEPTAQDDNKASYCKMIQKADGQIDWDNSAKEIYAQLRAYTPWPGIFTSLDGKTIKIHTIAVTEDKKNLTPGEILVEEKQLFVGTGTEPIEIFQIQPEGKSRMFTPNFLNGHLDLHGKFFK